MREGWCCDCWNHLRTHVKQLVVMADTCKVQTPIVADVPSVREAGYSFYVVQQHKVVGCCPGGQALTVRRCAIIPDDVLAVEVASMQTGVWEHQDGHKFSCEMEGL